MLVALTLTLTLLHTPSFCSHSDPLADKLDAERMRTGARGPMHGVPVLVKDNIDTAGLMRTTAGSLALMESRPSADAHVITLLKNAGRRGAPLLCSTAVLNCCAQLPQGLTL